MRKYALIMFIIMVSLIAAGCVSCLKSFQPTATPTPTVAPTNVPTTVPTTPAQTVTPTAIPPRHENISKRMASGSVARAISGQRRPCFLDQDYRADDWSMPAIESGTSDVSHGVVQEFSVLEPNGSESDRTLSELQDRVYGNAGQSN